MYFCYHTVLIRRCADNNEVSAERARQLIHGTELDEFKWSVEEYEFVATLDGTTCDICGNMDGKRFRISDFEEGATAPPLHPRCRCVTVPYFNDAFTRDEKRAARDEKDDGKTHFIRNMNYNDWKKQYVDKPQFIKHDSYVIVGGTKYVVDDKHVLSDHTQEEILIAQSLAKYFNSTVHLVPRVEYPKYISTPDYPYVLE